MMATFIRKGWQPAAAGLLLAAMATTVAAQAPQPGAPAGDAQPPALTVAPNAEKNAAEDREQARGTVPTAGPVANICDELVAFLEQKGKADAAAAAKPAGGQPAVQAPSSGSNAPATKDGPPSVDQPQHSSGQTAPIPKGASGGEDPHISVEQARALQQANDRQGCQDAARRMRRAGVTMPATLIALAALKPELLQAQ